jgi:hypothetical protein
MQQYNSTTQEAISDEVSLILKSIRDMSEKVFNISNVFSDDADDSIGVAEKIDSIYEARAIEVQKLKNVMPTNTEERLAYFQNNPQWEKYIDEIAPLEESNIQFLKERVQASKEKLNELNHNKSVLLYTPQIEVSYESHVV